jgi:prevent-host-death family protein
MDAPDHMALADVKNRLSEVVDRLEREHGRVVITKHGKPAAVVLSVDDLESLEETLEILGDQPTITHLRKSLADASAGRVDVLSRQEALALMSRG